MSNRALQFGGLAVAGGIGYYMYRAGGDPKTAEKKFEGTLSCSLTKPISPHYLATTNSIFIAHLPDQSAFTIPNPKLQTPANAPSRAI